MIRSNSSAVDRISVGATTRNALKKRTEGGAAFEGGTLPPPLELDDARRGDDANDSDTAGPSGKSPGNDAYQGWVEIGEVTTSGGKGEK